MDDEEPDDEAAPHGLPTAFQDIPTWEEAISFVLNPSLVEGSAPEPEEKKSKGKTRPKKAVADKKAESAPKKSRSGTRRRRRPKKK